MGIVGHLVRGAREAAAVGLERDVFGSKLPVDVGRGSSDHTSSRFLAGLVTGQRHRQ